MLRFASRRIAIDYANEFEQMIGVNVFEIAFKCARGHSKLPNHETRKRAVPSAKRVRSSSTA